MEKEGELNMPRKYRDIFSSTGFAPAQKRKFNGKVYELWTYGQNRKELLKAIKNILATDVVSYRMIYAAAAKVWAVYTRRK